MSSTHTNNADEYESDCWELYVRNASQSNKKIDIIMKRIPTSQVDLVKWTVLMQMVKSSLEVILSSSCYLRFTDSVKKSFNDQCIPLFCDAIKNNTIITFLNITPLLLLNDVGMKLVRKVLQSHTTITSLQFFTFYATFNESMGRDLEELIIANTTLKTLTVCVVGGEAKFVSRALPRNSTLTTLDVSGVIYRPLGNEGLRVLCEGLQQNHSITNIELRNSWISNEGATYLWSLLEVNHSITNVDLGHNHITILPESLAFLTHVKTLKLYGNNKLVFPPQQVVKSQSKLSEFFAEFRYGPMKFHFLLGFHERVGHHSSIQLHFWGSVDRKHCTFEPALLGCIFEFLP